MPGDLHLLPNQQYFLKSYSKQDIFLAKIITAIRKHEELLDKYGPLTFTCR